MQVGQNPKLTNKIVNNIGNVDCMDFSLRLFWLKYLENDQNLYNSAQNMNEHFHSFFEMLIILEGELEYEIGEDCVQVRAGEYILFLPQVRHRLRKYSGVLKKYTVAFNYQMEDKMGIGQALNQPYYLGRQTEKMLCPLRYVLEYLDDQNKYDLLMIQYQMSSFFWSLWDNLNIEKKVSGKQNDLAPNDAEFFDMVCDYLKNHASSQVSLEEVAKVFMISKRHLNRRLMQFKGVSYGKVRDEVKCSIARDLLSTNMSMSEISEAIGMSNEYSFNRFFKRVEGMTPGRYRDAIRSSNYK